MHREAEQSTPPGKPKKSKPTVEPTRLSTPKAPARRDTILRPNLKTQTLNEKQRDAKHWYSSSHLGVLKRCSHGSARPPLRSDYLLQCMHPFSSTGGCLKKKEKQKREGGILENTTTFSQTLERLGQVVDVALGLGGCRGLLGGRLRCSLLGGGLRRRLLGDHLARDKRVSVRGGGQYDA